MLSLSLRTCLGLLGLSLPLGGLLRLLRVHLLLTRCLLGRPSPGRRLRRLLTLDARGLLGGMGLGVERLLALRRLLLRLGPRLLLDRGLLPRPRLSRGGVSGLLPLMHGLGRGLRAGALVCRSARGSAGILRRSNLRSGSTRHALAGTLRLSRTLRLSGTVLRCRALRSLDVRRAALIALWSVRGRPLTVALAELQR